MSLSVAGAQGLSLSICAKSASRTGAILPSSASSATARSRNRSKWA